ncbi:MAG TPA: MoxR family ATPase, partial [Polyangiaceae bacterium]|nr:MoxR family ATPase [Polyangiaceae bacterium]
SAGKVPAKEIGERPVTLLYDPTKQTGVAPQANARTAPSLNDPADYLPDPGLVDAVNVALTLGQPLLVTGEAGAGKTQLAFSVAWSLKLDEPLKFDVKSTSTARDLFYSFDTLGRLHAVHMDSKLPATEFFHLNALGLAIVLSQPPPRYAELRASEYRQVPARASVVLIDEIDKAPRDFPNDLLNEIENLYFRVPELGNTKVEANPALPPVVILTSNSERDLPAPFLRRCIYYNIPSPDGERLRQIVATRIGTTLRRVPPFLVDALAFYDLLRAPSSGLQKPPSVAELLKWVTVLATAGDGDPFAGEGTAMAQRTMSALTKTQEDQRLVGELLRKWRPR